MYYLIAFRKMLSACWRHHSVKGQREDLVTWLASEGADQPFKCSIYINTANKTKKYLDNKVRWHVLRVDVLDWLGINQSCVCAKSLEAMIRLIQALLSHITSHPQSIPIFYQGSLFKFIYIHLIKVYGPKPLLNELTVPTKYLSWNIQIRT